MNNYVYIGTYNNDSLGGIYTFCLNPTTGALEQAQPVTALERPSWLAASADGRFLYSVLETDAFEGGRGGGVCAFAIDGNTGRLNMLNARPTGGRAPCHISMDSGNTHLFAANYHDGSVSVFPLNTDGRIGERLVVLQHKGSGPVRGRQDGPHAHFTTLTPGDGYLCAVDLGADRIFLYRYDGGMVVPDENRMLQMKPGSGPRHMAFHPNGRFAYVITELSNEIAVFGYTTPEAGFTLLHTEPALPEGFIAESYCASVRLSADGTMLYASNRGHDSISVFSVNIITGRLALVQHSPTLGQWPRDFAIDPSGRFLLVANQNSDTVITFHIEPGSGKLKPAGQVVFVPKPVCVRFV